MIEMIDYIIKSVQIIEGIERGTGIEPLIQEFVDEIETLGPEVRSDRIKKITAYYQEILKRSGEVKTAYKVTRDWAMGAFVKHHVNKIRKEYGLEESTSPLSYQEANQEVLVHKEWKSTFRYDLEGAGDIFRELSKSYNDMGYIMEKVKRLERLFQALDAKTLHYDDSPEKAQKEDSDKLSKMLNMWTKQPCDTEEQELAKNLNIAVCKLDFSSAKIFLRSIKSLKYDGQQLRIEE